MSTCSPARSFPRSMHTPSLGILSTIPTVASPVTYFDLGTLCVMGMIDTLYPPNTQPTHSCAYLSDRTGHWQWYHILQHEYLGHVSLTAIIIFSFSVTPTCGTLPSEKKNHKDTTLKPFQCFRHYVSATTLTLSHFTRPHRNLQSLRFFLFFQQPSAVWHQMSSFRTVITHWSTLRLPTTSICTIELIRIQPVTTSMFMNIHFTC